MMDNDIKAILLRIKEDIKTIEAGNAAAPILAEIDSDFHRIMELIKLFLISERDSYYGYFLMNMSFRADFGKNCIAGILLGEFPPVFESNPLLLCKFKLKEIIYIVCHEIDHVVLNHPAEMLKAGQGDPDLLMKFNLAADAAVNDRINDEIKQQNRKFMSPPDGLITSDVLGKMFQIKKIAHSESYAYYFELIKGKQDAPENLPNQQESMTKALSEEGDEGEGGAQGGEEGDYDSEVVTLGNCHSFNDHDWQMGDEEEDAAAAVRELVNAAVGMMDDEARGLMPAAFMSQVKKINEPPKLTWQQILKKYVGTITADKLKTRMRLNRRQPERFDIPGRIDDKVLKIVVAIDTSASVSDDMIAAIMGEIFAILAKRKHEITIIECDAQVQRVYKVKNQSDIQNKVVGRGGTCFTPVIEYVNNDRYYRDALMIYFTDGYGENSIPKPRVYRNIWVVFDDVRNLSLKEAYGTVIALER